jgi:hypothetical protein
MACEYFVHVERNLHVLPPIWVKLAKRRESSDWMDKRDDRLPLSGCV